MGRSGQAGGLESIRQCQHVSGPSAGSRSGRFLRGCFRRVAWIDWLVLTKPGWAARCCAGYPLRDEEFYHRNGAGPPTTPQFDREARVVDRRRVGMAINP